jgi:homoserine/homoserine lactone efflux protein
MSLHLWLTFCAANLLTSLSPGPGALASTNASMTYGGGQAMRLVIGLQAALILQLLVVGIGAGALLAASGTAFRILRLVGAAYLIWLGVAELRKALRYRETAVAPHGEPIPSALPNLFSRGVWVNLSNPKAVLFQAALVPNFIDAARALLPQYLIIAVTMCVIDTLIMGLYVYLAQHLAGRWQNARLWPSLVFGLLFIAFGVALFNLSAEG